MVCLVTICILSLPFTYAMTLNLGVPIKAYELALVIIVFLVIVDFLLSGNVSFRMRRSDRKVIALLAAFCISYAVSYAVGLPKIAGKMNTLPDWFAGRFNPYLASSLRVVQVFGDAVLFIMVLAYGRKRVSLFIKAWLIGAWLSALYSWYSIGSSLTGHEPILLPGMSGDLSESLIIGAFGRTIPRSGTFLEGNFAGPYMLLSAFLALSLYSVEKRRWVLISGWFLWATVFATFSTIPIVCALVVPVVVWVMKLQGLRLKEKRMLFGYTAIVALIVGCTQVWSIPVIKEAVAYKVFGAPDDGSFYQVSVTEREDFIQAGLKMTMEYPTMGVGPSNYGLFFDRYGLVPGLGFGRKMIANNVYVELLSEGGVVGLVAFLAFACMIMRRCLRKAKGWMHRFIALGFMSLLLMFNAFPTFAVAYVWVYFALTCLAFSSTGAEFMARGQVVTQVSQGQLRLGSGKCVL